MTQYGLFQSELFSDSERLKQQCAPAAGKNHILDCTRKNVQPHTGLYKKEYSQEVRLIFPYLAHVRLHL